MSSSNKYRKNVAVVVLNDQGQILACHRSDVSGAWQLPQGGIEPDETDEQAMVRELAEEIGVKTFEVIDKLDESIRYEWPEHLHSRGFQGQEQIYFLIRLKNHAEIALDLHDKIEFDKVEWVSRNQFLSRIGGFKAVAYEKALELFHQRNPTVIA